MNIHKLLARPKVFERVFGISPELFRQLAAELKPLWQEAETRRKTKKKRERAIGGGRKYVLSFEESLAMHLLYLRTYAPYIFIGTIFHIDDGSVTRYFQKLRPVVASKMKKIVIRQIPISQKEILDLIADATEQETERRKGTGYSGKKKKQSVKTQIMVNRKGEIRHVSSSVPGNIHDKKLYDNTGVKAGMGDLGYLGTTMKLPFKSSKYHKLNAKQKKYNLVHSRIRITVEHVFAHLKKFRILANRFRNRLAYYNEIFMTVAGLYNLKLG
jgi:DDE superfamily endonuclease/Helix-turn-helix of DDE superfamily endonuclease